MTRHTLAVLAVLIASGDLAAEDRFTVDHYLALPSIGGIAVSPDGDFVAYTQSTYDLEKDKGLSRVWMQPTSGGDPVPMTSTESSNSSPQWSPDGRYLAILSDRKDETTQVWLLDRRGGDAQQLTEVKQGVGSFRWSPDSSKLALVIKDATPADLDEEERPNPRPYVIDRLQFKQDYVGYLDRHRNHIYVFDVASKELRQLTSGDYDHSEPAWAPDSRRIAFTSNRTEEPDSNRNTDIWIVDTDASDPKPRQVTTATTAESSPAWSPDGAQIVHITTNPDARLPIYALSELGKTHVETGATERFDALKEIQVFDPRFSPDGRSILGIAEYRGEQQLIRIDAATGAVQAMIEGSYIVTEFEISPGSNVFALVSRPQRPAEVFALTDTGLRQLSMVSEPVLAGLELGTTEQHAHTAADGTELETFIIYPPGFRKNRSYPGVLNIHGGPQAQFDYSFDAEAQLYAAAGYVVVRPNPRGSTGYGQAFAEAIYRDWGGIDYEDIMAAMDFAVDEGWVDEDRMAVVGWSYGGMMTNHIITKTDRFKAAMTGASATLYMANYGHDQYQRWWEEELGFPWLAENRENWDAITPFYRLGNVTTPTLVVGGQDDWNVPIINSEQLYMVLKRRGIPTQLVVYPNEFHGLSVPSYEKDLYERYLKWLEKYVITN